MLNVLHTVRSLRIDGIANVVVRTVGALDPAAVHSHVCAIRRGDEFAPELRRLGVEPLFLGYEGPASAVATVRGLVRAIRRWRIDVVHANQTLDFLLAGIAARICRVPVVASVHWLAETDTSGFGPNGRLLTSGRRVLRGVFERIVPERLIAVSEAVRDTHARKLHGIFPLDKVEVVYPGISFATGVVNGEERALLRAQLGLGSAHPVLLNVGRLHAVKGQRQLVPMMQRVLERLPAARLVIAGGGELREELERMVADAGIDSAVLFLGPRLDVDQLLAACDALVLSSESEAAPLPLLEAMRAGKPVVATRVGGVPEMVREGMTGYVVPRRDPEALASAVIRMFEQPERAQEMGANARRFGEERFDIGISARRLEEVYAEVRRGKKGRVGGAVSASALRRRV